MEKQPETAPLPHPHDHQSTSGEKTHSCWETKKRLNRKTKKKEKVLGNSDCCSISQFLGTLRLNILSPSCFSPSVCLFKPQF